MIPCAIFTVGTALMVWLKVRRPYRCHTCHRHPHIAHHNE